MTTTVPVRIDAPTPGLVVGLVEAHGLRVAASPPALAAEIDEAVARVTAAGGAPEALRTAVRDLLRHGGYKPTGRGKPASEFLVQAATRGEFPRINAPVDALNLVSLTSGLPISIVDLELAGPALVLRLGRAGESYVFNHAGHAIDVEGLLCLARDGGACIANAVKDSMETKIADTTTRVLAVIYAPASAGRKAVLAACERLADLLRAHAGAAGADVRLLP